MSKSIQLASAMNSPSDRTGAKLFNSNNNNGTNDNEDSLLGVDLQSRSNNAYGHMHVQQISSTYALGLPNKPAMGHIPSASLNGSQLHQDNDNNNTIVYGGALPSPPTSPKELEGDVVTAGGLPIPSASAMKHRAPPAPMPPASLQQQDGGGVDVILSGTDNGAAIQLAMERNKREQVQHLKKGQIGEKSARSLARAESEFYEDMYAAHQQGKASTFGRQPSSAM